MRIKEETVNTIVIEKSRFITYLKPVESEAEFKDYLKEIRKKHYDATHVCSAFILGDIRRSNDDGEPSGTAGMPMMNALEKRGLDGVCALTVRYFGGIKLGTGGLVRAYGSSVSEAINCATVLEEITLDCYEIILDYEQANKLDHYLERETVILDRDYAETVKYTFLNENTSVLERIKEVTRGREAVCTGKRTITKVV